MSPTEGEGVSLLWQNVTDEREGVVRYVMSQLGVSVIDFLDIFYVDTIIGMSFIYLKDWSSQINVNTVGFWIANI